ncbi:MAG: FUSC family protein, partial [Lachnospiraceae bacterium]|nr:FUSC family protein [Lachnospiraceae bacterium]
MSKKKIKLPPIGLRIIKSAVAVFMCYAVNLLRAGGGIVFYSQLSALWCMQDYASDTKKNAIQRTEGTLIGALYGLIVLVMFNSVSLEGYFAVCARAMAVAAFIVPIIYT